MNFYKLEDTFYLENETEEMDIVKIFRDAEDSILSEFNNEIFPCYLFRGGIIKKGRKVEVGFISMTDCDINRVVSHFFDLTGVSYDKDRLSFYECTIRDFLSLMPRHFEKYGFVNKISGIFDIDAKALFFGGALDNCKETFIYENTFENASSTSIEINCKDTLLPEIERIFSVVNDKKIYGHPVHYMIFGNDTDKKDRISNLLLSSLYTQKRIEQNRIITYHIDLKLEASRLMYNRQKDTFSEGLEQMYRVYKGGAVVLSVESVYNRDPRIPNPLRLVARIVKQYKNDVLTVFSFPKEAELLRSSVFEYLHEFSFVEIKEDMLKGDAAKSYLEKLALSNNVSADRYLYKDIEKDTGYLEKELDEMFNVWYQENLKRSVYKQYSKIENCKKEIKEIKEKPATSDAYKNLMDLIGLKKAKEVMNEILDFNKANELFKSYGMSKRNTSMHMIFTGAPGTAKTTTARLFAQIMKDNGLLSVGDLIEVGKSDLCGRYVGWTAKMVKDKFEKAKGSVLFVDEAYSLCNAHAGGYGQEAIDTIVQEMENNRDDTVVIFAGYSDKMEEFLASNPGLSSRIAFHVPFDNYSVDELYEILELMALKEGYYLDKDVREKVIGIFEKAVQNEEFGNGRYVRNLFERARRRHASRLVHMDNTDKLSKNEVFALKAEDFDDEYMGKQEIYINIGFSA